MYLVNAWFAGQRERTVLESWDDVLAAMFCLEEDMYQSVQVVNLNTGKTVVAV